MCTTHLNMNIIKLLDNIKNQRIAALNYEESILRIRSLKNIKFESSIYSSCILATQIIMLLDKNIENIRIDTKLYLN